MRRRFFLSRGQSSPTVSFDLRRLFFTLDITLMSFNKYLGAERLCTPAQRLFKIQMEGGFMYPSQNKFAAMGSHCHVRIDAVRVVRCPDAGERRGRLGARPLRRVGNQHFVAFGPVGPNCDAAQAGPDWHVRHH